ncbi:DMT family transporter [Acidovorax sp. SUPP2522]|uniref:DMT family transporter n=1 Tax=unclassified Acidovorax TaxID=2684926 RepID=UPI00234A093B|nr:MULTISPECIES: DMT family transporter [unclassified Acidovorax]WCM99654.1 DMT family transporter [Acidovorax sp. GBBC 1281]GKT19037.1 DMT family transporter [Acidovorax sp. SUPP2522]
MSMSSLLLVVLAALVHALWNLLAKRAADVGPPFVFAYTAVGAVLYLPWVCWILLRDGMPWSMAVVGIIALSGVLHLGYSLCLQKGYRVADLSVVYPVARGTGPLFSTLGAFVLLAETPTPHGLLGVGAVLAGIGLIATQGRWAMFRQSSAQKGIRWGIATGLLIASYTVVDAYGVKTLAIAPVVLDWCANTVRLSMLLPWMVPGRAQAMRAMQGRWHLALAVGALAPLSYILVLGALSSGAPLSLVAPAREMSMMIGALLGMLVLREPLGRWRLAGCLLLTVGVILLGAS